MKFKQWLSDFKKLYLEHKKISIPLTALFLALVITFGCVLPIFVWGKKDNGNGNNNNPGGTIIGGDANGNTEYTVKVETVGHRTLADLKCFCNALFLIIPNLVKMKIQFIVAAINQVKKNFFLWSRETILKMKWYYYHFIIK